ncbi:MauE/DoxX family redox-associated membrane protein [Streptomyces sp. SID13031]|uniref:MauE/DoxX family redox-associated membrane protein n=1 Tax=Streptomyces sp. SID13031 TaxID=2706046 RepID=UPI0013C7C2DF|nr:MauE/DoxX family redox-associated membrane protein [Streptomyces sp. SID13031]NEA37371.1 methylamine utilization protein MauE [Streptomyces sp. SID13031]
MSGYAVICCRLVFGVVFAVSLLSKTRSRGRYADFVAAVPGLAPGIPVRLAAPAVIAGEAAVIVAMVLPGTAPLGFAVAVLLLIAFTAGIVHAIRQQQSVSCQCFGASKVPVGPAHVVRNGFLLLVAAVGLIAALGPGYAQPSVGVLTSAVLTGAVAAAAVLLTDEIADLFRSNH